MAKKTFKLIKAKKIVKVFNILKENSERFRQVITDVAFILLVSTLILNIIGVLEFKSYGFEIISSLRFQYTLAAALYLTLTVLTFKYKSMIFYANIILSLLIISLNISTIIPLYFTKTVSEKSNSIKVLMSNVLKFNKDKSAVLKQFKKENPDIIVTLEVDEAWEKELRKLDNLYPYNYFATRIDCFGMAVQSKYPLSNTEKMTFTEFYLPTIKTDLIIEGEKVTLIATHPLPPKDSNQVKLRNTQIQDISQIITKENNRIILAGDLNTTIFSSIYKSLIDETNLIDSRNGFGFLPTFPQGASILMKVPIDYILFKGFNANKTYTIDVEGSDHNGIVSILTLNP